MIEIPVAKVGVESTISLSRMDWAPINQVHAERSVLPLHYPSRPLIVVSVTSRALQNLKERFAMRAIMFM